LNLSRNLKCQVQSPLCRLTADDGRLMSAHALDEMVQLEFEGFTLLDWHRLAHDAFAAEFADDGRGFADAEFRGQDFFQHRTFFFAVARDAIDEAFLRTVIERDVTGHRATAEDANLAHPLWADAADGEIGHATIGKSQARIGDVFRFTEHRNTHRIDA